MAVLVTGGAGYIGSHTTLKLKESGFDVIVADNFVNSKREVIDRLENLCGSSIPFVEVNLREKDRCDEIFEQYKIEAVIHFAALKAVGESTQKPLEYYENNLGTAINILNSMKKFGVKCFVFSSSATVYGDPVSVPVTETAPVGGVTNPYGRTKLFIEQILNDIYNADNSMKIVILRYFNPIGAHPSGMIGEDPFGIPNNLLPYIAQVAVGRREFLSVYGDDYDTPDGTGIRDYIHIEDLADGHVAALKAMPEDGGILTYNLGTGRGYSVLEVVKAFSKACGKDIPYKIVDRRPGDIAAVYAHPHLAEKELGFKAKRDIDEMCRDTWNWQQKNPNGY